MCLCLGAFTSFFYMCTIREVPLTKISKELNDQYKKAAMGDLDEVDQSNDDENKGSQSAYQGKDWKGWLKEATFYIHGIIYMMVRVAVNVTMTMMPFYLNIVTKFEMTDDNPTPVALAIVPLISYIMSLLFSLFVQRPMTRVLKNRFYPMLISILVITVTSAPMAFLSKETRNWVYPLAGFQGIGLAIMLNTATSLISDVIGNDSENSAFVYGSYSLFDKFANGLVLLWMINQFTEDEKALKWIIGLTPIICAVCAYILTWAGNKFFSHKMAKITGINENT